MIFKTLWRKLGYTVCRPLYYNDVLQNSYNGVSVCAGTLRGKNAVVTGGSQGIGLAIAKRLVREGCSVVICGRNEKKMMAVVNENGLSDRLRYIVWDMTDIPIMDAKIEQLKNMFSDQRIDILINNAGVLTESDRSGRFRQISEQDYDYKMNTNFKATYLLSVKMADYMKQNNSGCIVSIASICAFSLKMMYSPYGMSKSGIITMTKTLNNKYEKLGVFFNYVAPGAVATAMQSLNKNSDIARVRGNIMNRMIIPEELAALVAFMASDYGKYLAGDGVIAAACETL